jgi:hypothetical protein
MATAPSATFTADITSPFSSLAAIPAGQWALRASPLTTLDPDIRGPVGGICTMVAGTNAFRGDEVGKFINVYGGIMQITGVTMTTVSGPLLSEMAGTEDANPGPAPSGAWSLEEPSWSPANGYPRTGELFQQRLGQASTYAQLTTWWLSGPDDFDKYVLGVTADSAVEYPMATRSLNRIEWLADNVDLFVGTAGSEHRARAGASDAPIGGDKIPLVERVTTHGCASIQPAVINRRVVFVDRSYRMIFVLAFNWEADGYDATDLTGAAEHITESGIKLGPLAVQQRLHPIIYFVRNDGQLVALTYNEKEKVIGFSRLITDGAFEAVACIPQPSGAGDQVWVIVRRTVNGQTKRYVEVFDDNAAELAGRPWTSLQTDCARAYAFTSPTTVLSGLSYLEGATVDVVVDGNYLGTRAISGGQIVLTEAAQQTAEVGLHYSSPGTTMRPAVDGAMVEGLTRSWAEVWIRLHESRGGRINGFDLQYEAELTPSLFTGDKQVHPPGASTDGRLTFEQHLPYPMTVLAMFGECYFGS